MEVDEQRECWTLQVCAIKLKARPGGKGQHLRPQLVQKLEKQKWDKKKEASCNTRGARLLVSTIIVDNTMTCLCFATHVQAALALSADLITTCVAVVVWIMLCVLIHLFLFLFLSLSTRRRFYPQRSDLLDKPWSQESSLLPPVRAFNFCRL